MSAPDLTRGVRASDAERERVAQLLQAAASEGRLSPEEAGDRLATASAATYREELHELIADLPAPGEHPRVGAWWVWSVARLAVVALMVTTFWGFWGARLLLWPLGFMAVAMLSRPWRYRRWRRFRVRAWGVAAGPGSRS
ncbi:MAG TPA: DUF1707 domain-containing protein [Gemmatimonadales bacterium]|jgi:hypothetical protein|nr:DUF1707 domain-containing protein [Gemmatimonadales bacterium]